MKRKTRKITGIAMRAAVVATLSIYSTKSSTMEAYVEKIYGDKVLYKAGECTYEQNDDGHFFTRPSPPQQEPTQQCVLNYNREPKEFAFQACRYESVLMKVNPGRVRVEDTKKWPYSIHAQISLNFDGDIYGGSGVLISSHHILTAAHNVFKLEMKNRWADSIEVYPGLNGKAAVFGRAKAARVYTFPEWVNNENPAYDSAIIVLDQPIGLRTGWGGLIGLEDVEEIISKKASITGYPGDKGFDQMWTMKHKLKSAEAEIFSYEIDTYDGQSGSGIWTLQGNDPYIMGVHTLGHDSMNYGVRLSRYKFHEIVNWVSRTRHIEKGVEDIPIPLIARGYEEIYLRFLRGKIIYRPNKGSDVGMVELPIAALADPLKGTFVLSRCGDARKIFSISTGYPWRYQAWDYQKKRKPVNSNKVEIWIVPRFLVEERIGLEKRRRVKAKQYKSTYLPIKQEIGPITKQFMDIFPTKWPETVHVGIFWTLRDWDDLTTYNYLTNQTMEEISSNNLLEKYRSSSPTNIFYNIWDWLPANAHIMDMFSCSFCDLK